jgi:hypothetical protein
MTYMCIIVMQPNCWSFSKKITKFDCKPDEENKRFFLYSWIHNISFNSIFFFFKFQWIWIVFHEKSFAYVQIIFLVSKLASKKSFHYNTMVKTWIFSLLLNNTKKIPIFKKMKSRSPVLTFPELNTKISYWI